MANVKEYLLDNEDKLLDVVQELNSWNGSFEELRFYDNDEYTINELFSSPYDFAEACSYGEYNFNEDYFKFDNLGNIQSYTYREMVNEVRDNIDDIVDALKDKYHQISIDDELRDLIEGPEKEEKFSSLDDLIKGATEKSKEQPLKEEKSVEMER